MPRVYPVLLLMAFLASERLEQWAPWTQLTRPAVVLIASALVLQLLLGRLSDADRAAYFTSLAMMILIDWRVSALLLFGLASVLLLQSVHARSVAVLDWKRLTRFLTFVTSAALIAGIAQIGTFELQEQQRTITAVPERDGAEGPDIYLIILDAYPRSDTIERELGYSNATFLTEMKELGFDVATASRSNYNRTVLTLTSMLNGRLVQELLPDPPAGMRAQHRAMSTLINHAAGVANFHSIGYDLIVIPTQIGFITPVHEATVMDSGFLTEFEYHLARNGLVANVLQQEMRSAYVDQHRGNIEAAFDSLIDLASEPSSRPRLVFAHLLLPHNPVVFNADGTPANLPGCYWEACDILDPLKQDGRQAVVGQIEYTNRRIREAASTLLARSKRPPVIVILGDHGLRHWASNRSETFENLFLSYTPGAPQLFPETATPVNILPTLMSRYVGITTPLADPGSWVATSRNGYFPFRRWEVADETTLADGS